MKNLFTLKWLLALLALLLVGLCIWFIGPLFSVDNLYPLKSAEMRVTVIVLALLLTVFLLVERSIWSSMGLALVGVVALSVLIWHAGPLLKFGGMAPLSSELVRMVVLFVLVLGYLIWAILKVVRAAREDKELRDRLLNMGRKGPSSVKLAEDNIRHVKAIMAQAVAQLRRMRTSASMLTRLFEGKRYLYELPWFLVIGNPGAGKTTAMLNSGLKFLLPQQMSMAALHTQSHTDKCDWWFTDEAVLIDTAGRYTQHTEGEQGRPYNEAEWLGFLHLLRQHRPRAPINGAMVMVSVADLMGRDALERTAMASDLRARLVELRQELGIRFPVYLVFTKMDMVPGFEAYFSTLVSQARSQVWGFTLPYGAETEVLKGEQLRARCEDELKALHTRIDSGLNVRLQEEFEPARRRALALLPQEFEALIEPVTQVIDEVFAASRYDNTQMFTTLRGVYFTSAAQTPAQITVDRLSVWQRLRKVLTGLSLEKLNRKNALVQDATGNRSYFLHDLLTRLVFTESHLVRPNVGWEWRYRMLRIVGHALILVLCVWLFAGVWWSSQNNHDYVRTVSEKTQTLNQQLKNYYAKPSEALVPGILDAAHDLTAYPQLDAQAPPTSWRYGLYAASDLVAEQGRTYDALQDRLFLPFLLRRVETVMGEGIDSKDEELTYGALRTYLLLNERERYAASEVKLWMLRDWEESDSADVFGNHPTMVSHIQRLFDGRRVVQSPFVRNEALIQKARQFLDGKPSMTRVYERIKADLTPDSPDPFTLISALGPQLAGSFARTSEAGPDEGIPGLFTYAGYHELFKKQLPEALRRAYEDDNFVMGRRDPEAKDVAARAMLYDPEGKLASAIRRLYFEEYAQRWSEFLDDLRAPSGQTRAFSLQTMRVFVAPDSPLIRLARAAVKETTLTRGIDQDGADKSLIEKASAEISKKTQEAVSQLSGARAQARLERQLVDNRFAPLREIVTGESSSEASDGADKANKTNLNAINGLMNAYYAQLTVADNALSAQSIPAPAQAGINLRLEATRMPAPFRNVISDLVYDGLRLVNEGVGDALIAQTESVVGAFCRRAVVGKYPFVNTDQEVDADDFARLFAAGGLMDDFFQKVISPYVDTNVTPWRYKRDAADLAPVAGPDLSSFAKAIEIRETFFRDPAGRKMSWKADVRVVALDPSITELTLNFDGQTLRYVHGPSVPWSIVWPGPRGGVVAEVLASPRIKSTSALSLRGPWAIFRLFQAGQISGTANQSRTVVDLMFDGRAAVLEVNAGTQPNPLTSDVLKGFKCPGRRA